MDATMDDHKEDRIGVPINAPSRAGEIKILMLEDQECDAELTERELRRGGVCFQPKRVVSRQDFERELKEFGPDLVLADYALPSYDGLSALDFVIGHFPVIPFIFVSGTMGEEFAVEGLRQGATDYVLKNHLARLVPAVHRALREAEARKDKQRASAALCESEQRYKRLIESVTDYIYSVRIVDGTPRETMHGPGCVSVTGYTTEEYDRDPYLWYRMVHREDCDAVKKLAEDILAGKALPIEHRILHKNGSVRWVRNTPVPRYDERKRLVSYDGLVVDITERKGAEEALIKYKDTLEERVGKRTRELEEARKQAETASRTKSEFLANMSHELRTPLNSVIGFSEVLQDELFGTLNEKQREYVGNICGSGRHLLQLINDILDLSKVEAGKMELEPSSLQLKKVLEGSLAMFQERAMKHAIALDFVLAPGADCMIVADERKLKQIMYNLLSNAMKFTLEGGSVSVRARKVQSSKYKVQSDEQKYSELRTSNSELHEDLIEISVADTGIGIKTEDISKLFQEFTQLESSYSRNHEGTGLGLALTKRFVELHGGTVRVESEYGKGSTFSFSLPFGPRAEKPERSG
jgi:PAS domain S-box-containing protein